MALSNEIKSLLSTYSKTCDNCFYYPTLLRRVQKTPKTSTNITRYLYSRELVRQVSRNAQATNWIEVTKKMADNLNYFSDNKESEWLASIDPSLLDKSIEEKQLNESELSSFIEENRNSNTKKEDEN